VTLRFGRYEALFRVAQGGMAEVFAARIRGEAGFERLVAVKRMLPHLAGDERFVNMFLDEARLAAPLASPHVVSTLDLGRDEEGSPYIVLELVVGASLAALLNRAGTRGAPIPVPVALEILAQTALGLHHAHEALAPSGAPLAIVHRDVSPQNVIVGTSGTVKVSDFGIAKAAIARLTHTAHGSIKGKIAYLSPEQANARAVDRRSDVYALGVVAWEVLAGRRLHDARDAELLGRVRRPQTAPLLSSIRGDLPASLVSAVARALAIDPDARWSTAGELAEVLRTHIAAFDPTWAGPPALARWLRADPPSALTALESRLREASDGTGNEGTEPGAGRQPTEVLAEETSDTPAPRASELEEATKVLPAPPRARAFAPWIAVAAGVLGLGAVAVVALSSSPMTPLPAPPAVLAEEVPLPQPAAHEPPAIEPAAIQPPIASPEPIAPAETPAVEPPAPRARPRPRVRTPVDPRAPLDMGAFDRGAARR
jgi:serine/threonine protein kinase